MRAVWLVGACLSALLCGRSTLADEPIALKVLYAGNPSSDREKDFTGFLAKSFAKVGTTDFQAFKEDEAQGYDVVILDWTSIYPRDEKGKLEPNVHSLKSPHAPKLSSSFARPTILIGAAGGWATMSSQLKIDWL
jgi:hypothetical protein